MGVDWVPMRPREGAEPSTLRALIAAQARSGRAAGRWPRLLDDPPDESSDERDDPSDVDADERLLGLLRVEGDDGGTVPSFRVGVIGNNPSLPPEWRDAAWTTLLPDEAGRAVRRWRWWYEQISAGHLTEYRRRLAAWNAARDLDEVRAELIAVASRTLDRTNAWARADRLERARQRVLALPAAPRPPAVGPPPSSPAEDRPIEGQTEDLAALAAHLARTRTATAEFNSAVPNDFKVRYPHCRLGPVGPAHDGWLEQFFGWVEPVIRTGRGLYLWQ
jgi:hypothetical protein